MSQAIGKPATNRRWLICGLLFAITTINYMDRNILGVLKPTIQSDLHFSETDFGDIIFFFTLAYAFGYAGMGWLTDRIGIRWGLAVAATLWCLASTAHGMVASVGGFMVARIALGLGEGGNFPTCIKTIATWFPVRDRAFATGLFNSGSNIGAMFAPLIGAAVVAISGWQAAFYVSGLVGLLWVGFWLVAYRSPAESPKVSSSELAYIDQDPEVAAAKVPWTQLLRHSGTWVYLTGAVLTNPAWWFYNNWVPSFLNTKFHVSLFAVGLPLVLIYLMTDVGSIAGGWVSSRLIKGGMDVFAARKITLLLCAACTLPVFLVPQLDNLVDGGRADRYRHGGTSGLLGQPVHPGFRYAAARRGCLGGWPGRWHQRGGGGFLRGGDRARAGRHRQQLHGRFLRLRQRLCHGDRDYPRHSAAQPPGDDLRHHGAGRRIERGPSMHPPTIMIQTRKGSHHA